MANLVLLHLNGTNGSSTITDEVGIYTWPTGSANISTAQSKFGGASLRTNNFVWRNSNNAVLPLAAAGAWSADFWFWADAVTNVQPLLVLNFNNSNSSAVIIKLGAGALHYYLSSNSASVGNIANNTTGIASGITATAWHHVALTYDAAAGKYYGYLDGVKDFEVTSAAMVHNGSGQQAGYVGADGTNILQGYIDELYITTDTTSRFPGGTTFSVPTGEYTVPSTPGTAALSLTGFAPRVIRDDTIRPGTGSLSLTGQQATVQNSGLIVITPGTGSLALAGSAPTVFSSVIKPATGTLALTGIAPIVTLALGPSVAVGVVSMNKYIGVGTAGSGAVGSPSLRSYQGTGEVQVVNAANGAATMNKYAGTGLSGYVSNPSLRAYSGQGQATVGATGAAVLRAYESRTTVGFAKLRKYVGAGIASAVIAETYRTHAMNTATNAVTEYQNFRFNSYAMIGGQCYGAGPDGLIRLDGDTDAGANIDWKVRTGQIDDGQIGLKRLPEVVAGLRASGPVRVRVYPDDNQFYDYMLPNVKTNTIRQHRVKVGKGMESRYFSVELQGVSNSALELDSLQFNLTPTTRRIG